MNCPQSLSLNSTTPRDLTRVTCASEQTARAWNGLVESADHALRVCESKEIEGTQKRTVPPAGAGPVLRRVVRLSRRLELA